MVECSPEISQYLSQNFPNTFVAAIFAGEIGVKSVASEQALGICTFWQSGLPDYTCSSPVSESSLKFRVIETSLKYGVVTIFIVDAHCHFQSPCLPEFSGLYPTLAIHTHVTVVLAEPTIGALGLICSVILPNMRMTDLAITLILFLS